MIVGDKILCIESREELNLKNNIYTILSISSDIHDIHDIEVSIEKSIYYVSAHYSNMNSLDNYVFDDYFITLKDIRKLKLKKLNERG